MAAMTTVWAVLGLVTPAVGVIVLGAPGLLDRLVPVRGRRPGILRDGKGTAAVTTPATVSAPSPANPSARRGRPPTDAEVAQWCDDLARRVRTGDTLVTAIRAQPSSPAMADVVRPVRLGLDRGTDLATAVRLIGRRTPAIDLAVTVLTASARLGGPAAEPIDRAAAAIRRRVADEAERRTHSAQARSSALTLTTLPGAILLLLAVSSSDVRAQLTEPLGTTSVVLGAALNLVGWRWMRRIVERAP